MGNNQLIFDDVKIILQNYGIPDEEAGLIRRITNTYPENVYCEWLLNFRDRGIPKADAGKYLNGCIRQYEKEQDAIEREELYREPARERPYTEPKERRASPGANGWHRCHDCRKMMPCTYWNDPIEDARHSIDVHAGEYDWYCDACYQKRIVKADLIWETRKREERK